MPAAIHSGTHVAPATHDISKFQAQDLLARFNARRLAFWGIALDELALMAERQAGTVEERSLFMWNAAIEVLYGRTVL